METGSGAWHQNPNRVVNRMASSGEDSVDANQAATASVLPAR